jgi:hypothetical protein
VVTHHAGRNLVNDSVLKKIHSGDYVCTEFMWGDNIEAVVDGNSTCIHTTKMNFLLRDLDNNTVLHNHTERHHPYFMFGNIGTNIFGQYLPSGRYQLTVTPFQRFPTHISAPSQSIDFEMIECTHYRPPNQCKDCPYNSTNQTYACDGSMCLKDEYVRITLIQDGSDLFDYGLKVTTPHNTPRIIGAYGADTSLSQGAITSDPFISGGYVDEDFHYMSCRSFGRWTKSIVFPYTNPNTEGLIAKGTYVIQLEDLYICGIVPTRPNDFELKIYQNHTLIHTYSVGRTFTLTLV